MEQSLIEVLAAWASRNPVYPVILLGPIFVAVVAVLVNARRAPAVDPQEAPAEPVAAVEPAGTVGGATRAGSGPQFSL